jgi:hypothetical protein
VPDLGPLAGPVKTLQTNGPWDAARAALTELLAAEASPSGTELVIEVPYGLAVATCHG